MQGKRWIKLMIMTAILLIPTTGCMKNTANTVAVDQTAAADKWQTLAGNSKIVQIADELYAAANVGNRQLAYASLVKLEKESKDPAIRTVGERTGWEAFDHSIQQAKKALSSSNLSAAYLEASRLKLAVDAIFQQAPLWHQYRALIQDDMNRLHQSWVVQWEDRPSAELAALQVLRVHAERFEVAALLERPEERVASFQDQISRMEYAIIYAAKSGEMNERSKALDEAWTLLQRSADSLFQDSSATKTAAGGIEPADLQQGIASMAVREQLTTMFIGAFVMSVLAFVGWRRYKFEESHGAAYPPPKSPWDR
ncbi:hypothetical protein FHS18_001360 [Paenibacillus phyllosphaerae]|uniref:Sporulation protein YpjB n=1 Tax=Paenibacillus phyllosphaerae TaxID=274593 RepID=A0A7W5AV20_9BACL|nr:sporulation protein YpjB [Paenibacillus phyllosphaerae]MBB3109308.1 hypothetical protein [Paenibacillus phyllosphaerae]